MLRQGGLFSFGGRVALGILPQPHSRTLLEGSLLLFLWPCPPIVTRQELRKRRSHGGPWEREERPVEIEWGTRERDQAMPTPPLM